MGSLTKKCLFIILGHHEFIKLFITNYNKRIYIPDYGLFHNVLVHFVHRKSYIINFTIYIILSHGSIIKV